MQLPAHMVRQRSELRQIVMVKQPPPIVPRQPLAGIDLIRNVVDSSRQLSLKHRHFGLPNQSVEVWTYGSMEDPHKLGLPYFHTSTLPHLVRIRFPSPASPSAP